MLHKQTAPGGFTLAELLIALAILGVIATFTIPKVLVSSQNQRFNAVAKEAMATISDAYRVYKTKNTVTGSFSSLDLAPYLNYVKLDTSSTLLDNFYPCSSDPCHMLHNGGAIQLRSSQFLGTTNVRATELLVDPDGGGPGSGVWYFLYYDGRITTSDNCIPGTVVNGAAQPCPNSGNDPTWLKW